jgi:hypothetical protein
MNSNYERFRHNSLQFCPVIFGQLGLPSLNPELAEATPVYVD